MRSIQKLREPGGRRLEVASASEIRTLRHRSCAHADYGHTAAGRRRTTLLVLLLAAALGITRADAAVITVTTTTDENVADGDSALREAVRAANSNAPVDCCPAGQNDQTDTLTVPAGAYTLTLAGADDTALSGDLDLVGNATVTDLVISGVGFYMPSLWEIFNTAALEYDTSRGVVLEAGDEGPPTELVRIGWIRGNAGKRNASSLGEVTDCNRYATTQGSGTLAGLPSTIQDPGPATGTSPWGAGTAARDLATKCDASRIEAARAVVTYLVEHYLPGATPEGFRQTAGLLRSVAAPMTSGGSPVCCRPAILVPSDEAAIGMFEAASIDVIAQLYRRPGIAFDRIVGALEV